MQPLLSISIPTYNRAGLLAQCLQAIISQLPEAFKGAVEIIVSNNASTDATASVVSDFQAKWPVVYFENSSNLGPDRNILQCFVKATGRYVWIFSDDDVLLPGTLRLILNFLEKGDYGLVQLGTIGYDNQIEELLKYYNPASVVTSIYKSPIEFFEKLNYMATFITGNIVNKSILKQSIDYEEFLDTHLVQLGWVIRAIFSGIENAQITTKMLGCKQDNTGGYNLITIFAKKYNIVMNELVNQGIDKKIIYITNNHLLASFFPQFLGKILYGKHGFDNENGFDIMFSHYWKYFKFWQKIFPTYTKFFAKKAFDRF